MLHVESFLSFTVMQMMEKDRIMLKDSQLRQIKFKKVKIFLDKQSINLRGLKHF